MVRALPFVENRRAAALCEAAAHHSDDASTGVMLPYGIDLVNMPVMEGIVFCNDADGVHRRSSFYQFFL